MTTSPPPARPPPRPVQGIAGIHPHVGQGIVSPRAASRAASFSAGSPSASSGRSVRLRTRRSRMAKSACSHTETPCCAMPARVSAFMRRHRQWPARTARPGAGAGITRFSPSRTSASPRVEKISGMVMPAARSISSSASRNGSRGAWLIGGRPRICRSRACPPAQMQRVRGAPAAIGRAPGRCHRPCPRPESPLTAPLP